MESCETMRTQPEASIVGLEATSAEQVLRQLADAALAAGLVESGFAEAVVARERQCPTGLPTASPVAIPHADPCHVRRSGFTVATLARPVPFGVMGSADQLIDVELVVMLLIRNTDQVMDVLTRLVAAFQQDGWDEGLRAATTPAELASAFDALVEGENMEG